MDKEVDKILSRYKNSYTYYRTKRDEWTKYYKRYRSILDIDSEKDYYKWRSKLFIPATARAVDGLLPDLMLTLFPNEEFFQVQPREMSDVASAERIQALLLYEFGKTRIFDSAMTFIKQLAMYGTSFGKVYWTKKTRKLRKRVQNEMFGINYPGYNLQDKDILCYEGPVFEPIDVFNMYYSTNATSLDESWVIQRSEKTLAEIKQLGEQGIYKNTQDLENYILAENTSGDNEERRYLGGLPTRWGKEEGNARKVEILEYWDENRERVITVGGQAVVLRDKPNPLYIDPFIYCTLWDLPFELLGQGVPEKSWDIQDQLNCEVNQRLDNRKLRQNLIIKVRRGANVNVRNLLSRPGAVWLTDDMEAIQTENIPDISSATSFQEESLLKQEIEEITGVTKYATGSGADSRRTATEASILTRSSTKGFALMITKLAEEFVKPVVTKYYQLTEMFMSKDVMVRITGQDVPTTISPDDVYGEYDFVSTSAASLANKDVKTQQMITMLQMAAQDPTLNRQYIYKKIWEGWGYKDFDQLFKPPVSNFMPMGMPGQTPPTPEVPSGGEMRAGTMQEGGAPMGTEAMAQGGAIGGMIGGAM